MNLRPVRAFALGVLLASPAISQDPEVGKLQELLEDPAASFWVYDDLARAEAMARDSGKPLLVSFRCVP